MDLLAALGFEHGGLHRDDSIVSYALYPGPDHAGKLTEHILHPCTCLLPMLVSIEVNPLALITVR
jgi:hypothetical protein